ncbi:MAG: hypothetical protein ACTSPY_09550 [Candidatus Helarchaeota archaeon]
MGIYISAPCLRRYRLCKYFLGSSFAVSQYLTMEIMLYTNIPIPAGRNINVRTPNNIS